MDKMNKEDLKRLKFSELAKKHDCSISYVRKILIGERDCKTVKAFKIQKDAADILSILERETKVTI